MKKTIVTLMLLTFTAFASITTDGLTEVQQAELALQVAQMKKTSGITTVSTVDSALSTLSKFEGIGRETGLAVKNSLEAVVDVAAKFSNTPVGKITIALVVWRVAGEDMLHFLIGVTVFIIGLLIFRRTFFTQKIPTKYIEVPRIWGLYTVSKPSDYTTETPSGETQAMGVMALIVGTLVFVIALA